MTNAPAHGARFELLRASVSLGEATYTIAVQAGGDRFDASATIKSGALDTRWTHEPAAWIRETTNGFLKILQKNHAHDASWPSRLVRWRQERE